MTAEPRDPQLETLFALAAEQVLESILGMEIGRVVSYDTSKQSASIQPVVIKAYIAEDETRVAQIPPQRHGVPVRFLGGARGRITVPVMPGDYGLLIYSSLSIRRWKQRGDIVDPGDDSRHDVNDCVFMPGMHDFAHVPTTAPTDAIVLHAGDGVKVKVGGPIGTQPTIMADSFIDGVGPVGGLSSLLDSIIAAVEPIPGPLAAAKIAFDALTVKTSKTEVK